MKKSIYIVLVILISGCSKEFSSPDSYLPSEDMETKLMGTLGSVPLKRDWKFQFVDNFDHANSSNNYGINDNLGNRQLQGPWKNTNWTRKEGTWYNKTVQPWLSQANHIGAPNALSFHLEHSAVMLNRIIYPGSNAGYRISFTTDPVKNDQASTSWTSFMLDQNSTNKGYVTETEFGFLISSNGNITVFQNGNIKPVSGLVAVADTYKIVLDIIPGQLTATINGQEITATLDEQLPVGAYLYLGAYIESDSGDVSWFDDLVISTQYHSGESRIKHYGYYWASSAPYGEHLSEVSDYTNFNFIETVSSNTPNTKTHVLQARWQFWIGTDGQLRPDWQSAWNTLLADINLNIDKIKALYVIDEPFFAVKVSVTDYNMVLDQIKLDLPNLPIIAVFAHPIVDDVLDARITNISNSLDWVGADKYVSVNNFSQVIDMNDNLMDKRPNTPVFLIPQTHFEGTPNDSQVAEINWKFYEEALINPKVIGIWNFGLWTHEQPQNLPITMEVQRLIGNAIVNY